MAEEPKSRLGRGLAALISDVGEERTGLDRARGAQQRRLSVDLLEPSPRNPRRSFDEAELTELTESVRERGVVQPILARALSGGRHEIIAGERRWRAAQRAGVHDVPVVVLDVSEREALEIAIVENVQRADLNAVEEAAGYDQLMGEFSYRQEDLARVIGKSRSHIANTLRLLKLPDAVKAHVRSGALSAGHARALLVAENPAELAERVLKGGLSVRATEALVKKVSETPADNERRAPETKSADTQALETLLSQSTGLKVKVAASGTEAGEVRISYRSLEQLDELIRRLRG